MSMQAEVAEPNAGRARWTWLAALGLVFVAAGPALLVLASVLWGLDVGEDLPFFLALIAVPLLAALAVWRLGVPGKIIGILVGLAAAGMLFWTAFGLFTPASVFDFVPGLLVPPGALLAVGASIAALVAGRRGHRSIGPEGKEATAIRTIVAVVVILAVLSGILTLLGKSSAPDEQVAATVVLSDFEFPEGGVSVASGSKVLARNDDPFTHTFTIDALSIDESLTPGSEKIVTITANPGTFVLYCKPHTSDPDSPSDDDMATTLTVT